MCSCVCLCMWARLRTVSVMTLLMMTSIRVGFSSLHSSVVFGQVLFSVKTVSLGQLVRHTPSIAFRHLPPNSARFSYATEGVLFISAQLSSDAVSALRKVPVLI